MNAPPTLHLFVLFTLLALLAACAAPAGPGAPTGARKVVGPAGGTVATPDGAAVLEFPPDALASDTTITIAPGRAGDPNIVPGTSWEFGPDGIEFPEPVTLTLRYDPADLPAGSRPAELGIVEERADGTLDMKASSVDAAARTVSAPIGGFSGKAVWCCVPITQPTVAAEYQSDRSIDLTIAWPTGGRRGTRLVIERAVYLGQSQGIPRPVDSDFSVWTDTPNTGLAAITDRSIGRQAGFYFYRVRGRAGNELGPPSIPARVAVFGARPRPGTPASLTAVPLSGNRVGLYWSDTTEVDRFELQRSSAGSGYATVATLPGTELFHTDTGLDPDTRYDYRLRAVNSVGPGRFVVANATTLAACTDIEPVVDPGVRSVVDGSSGSITIALDRAPGFADEVDLFLEGDTDVFDIATFAPGRTNGTSGALNYTLAAGQAPRTATLTLRAESVANPTSGCATTFVLEVAPADTTGPAIVIDRPADGATVSVDAVDLDATVSDPSGVESATISLNGVEIAGRIIPTPRPTEVDLTTRVTGLAEGTNTITIAAEDTEGNPSSATVQVTYDPEATVDCDVFTITVTRDPVEISPNGSTSVGIFIDRPTDFAEPVAFALEGATPATPPAEFLSAWSFDPNPAPDTSTTLDMTLVEGIGAGNTFGFVVVATEAESQSSCRAPFDLEVVP